MWRCSQAPQVESSPIPLSKSLTCKRPPKVLLGGLFRSPLRYFSYAFAGSVTSNLSPLRVYVRPSLDFAVFEVLGKADTPSLTGPLDTRSAIAKPAPPPLLNASK